MSHSTGPWVAEDFKIYKEWNKSSFLIANTEFPIWHENKSKGEDERASNASLISASPELLLALKDTMLTLAEVAKSTNTYQGLIDSPGWIRAMAAVNKAEGKK